MEDDDKLTPQEIEELEDPDDNPDRADLDVSAHRVHVAAGICTGLAIALALAAGVCIGMHCRCRRD
ncbi:MAG: hypothetical protein UHD09_05320 [Bifidobacterium sp.]|nr:hypothetical protein [Bifidobacterium sp.]